MTRRAVAVVAVLFGTLPFTVAGKAGCVGPGLELSSVVAARGDFLTLHGTGWFDGGCDDTGPDEGCGSSDTPDRVPATNILVSLVGPRHAAERGSILLGTVDGPDFSVRMKIPEEINPGFYWVVAERQKVGLTIRK